MENKMNGGWFPLWRSIVDHWLWDMEPYSWGQSFVELLLLANPVSAILETDKGEIGLFRSLKDRWRWTDQEFQRFIGFLTAKKTVEYSTTEKDETVKMLKYTQHQELIKGNIEHGRSMILKREGWFKIQRRILKNKVWIEQSFSKAQAYVDLLLRASYKEEGKVCIKGKMITLKAGEQARSLITLGNEWKWSVNKVRRFLELLQDSGMVTVNATALTSIISITKYQEFRARIPGTQEQKKMSEAVNTLVNST